MRRLPTHPSLLVVSGNSIEPVDPGARFASRAARVDRLTADRELVDRIMWSGYQGPDWERFSRALVEYGVAVMRSWIRSGRIFVECRRKGFGSVRRKRHDDADDADGLAGETVAVSLCFFRDKVLIPGAWDMTKGASLNTYFIGACIRHFPNVYSRADGSELLMHLITYEADEDPITLFGDRTRMSRPDRRVELANAFDAIDDAVVREVLLGEAEGFTQEQTAIRLGKTRWAIEGTMRRYRGGSR